MSNESKRDSSLSINRFIKTNSTEIGVFLLLVVLCLGASLASDIFMTYQNISSICSNLSYYGIIAAGATVVMVMGGIDLSQMSVMAVGVVTCGQILNSGIPGAAVWAILAAVVLGFAGGLINGWLVAGFGIAPMIATIGTQYIFRALAFIIVTGQSCVITDRVYKVIGFNAFLGFPIPLWIMLIAFIVIGLVMKYTQFGQNVYAVGSNEVSARLSGINIRRTKIGAYCLAGVMSGIASIIWAAQLSAAKPTAGKGSELIPIAAVVIGGVSLTGGKGKIAGVLFGVSLIVVLSNIMTLLHLSTYLQQLFQGVILIVAVIAGMPRKGRLDI